jgi:hypothetical protein
MADELLCDVDPREEDDAFLLFDIVSLRGLVLGCSGRVGGLAWRWLLGYCALLGKPLLSSLFSFFHFSVLYLFFELFYVL